MTSPAGRRPYDANNVWVTMLTNDDYVDGVIVLAHSLLRADSRYRLLVLLTSRVSDDVRDRLARLENCQLTDVDAIAPPPGKTGYAFPHFAESWTKLAIWKIERYRRLVWLDADMLVLRNMDELFDIQIGARSIAATAQCLCNALRFANFPAYFSAENCPYHSRPGHLRLFNAGLLVITPSTSMYNELIYALRGLDLDQMHFAEQDLLNQYFADRWHVLDYSYNATKGISQAHPEMWDLSIIKNIHYVGKKPWNCDMGAAAEREDPMFHINKPWWDIREEAFARIYPSHAVGARSTSKGTVSS